MGVTAHLHKAGVVVLPEADGVGMGMVLSFFFFFHADSPLRCSVATLIPRRDVGYRWLERDRGSGRLSSKHVISRGRFRGCPFLGLHFGSVIAR